MRAAAKRDEDLKALLAYATKAHPFTSKRRADSLISYALTALARW
jgi:hypothetical protein